MPSPRELRRGQDVRDLQRFGIPIAAPLLSALVGFHKGVTPIRPRGITIGYARSPLTGACWGGAAGALLGGSLSLWENWLLYSQGRRTPEDAIIDILLDTAIAGASSAGAAVIGIAVAASIPVPFALLVAALGGAAISFALTRVEEHFLPQLFI